MEEMFVKCDSFIYRMQMTDHLDYHKFVISKKSVFAASLGREPYPATTW
jgi:hypothetical protein